VNIALLSLLAIFSPAILIILSRPTSTNSTGWLVVLCWFTGAAFLITELIKRPT